MNSNLVPQLRADVNGKLVTRHVKQDAAANKMLKSVPVPALPTPQRDVRDDLINEMTSLHKNSLMKDDFDSFIRSVPEGYAEALYQGLQSSGDGELIDRITKRSYSVGAGTFMGLSIDFMKSIMSAYDETNDGKGEFNTIKLFNQVYNENFDKKKTPETYDFKRVLPEFRDAVTIQALGCTEGAISTFETRENYATVAANRASLQNNIRPLLLVTDAMWQINKQPDIHQVVELSNIIDEHPGTGDLIAGFVKQRGRLDMDEIRSLVEGATPPLASGLL